MSSIESYNIETKMRELRSSATVIADSVAFNFSGFTDDARFKRMMEDIDFKSRDGGYRILVLNAHCLVVDDSNRDTNISLVGSTLIVPEVVNAMTRRSDTALRRNEEAIYASTSIYNENNVIGAVLLVESVSDIYEQMRDVQNTILLYSSLVLLLIFLLVFFISKLLLGPLNGILRVVQRTSHGHLDQRIPLKGHDEYFQLAQAFNNMTEKLEQEEKPREEFVSNVSHELKTPLSSMKVLSESLLTQEDAAPEMYREFLQDINSEVDRMTLIINDLLTLVRNDQRDQIIGIFAATELNKMVEEILKRLSPLAEKKEIVLLYEDVRAVTIDADEMKLSLAISNIVENGIKYTPRGGTVKVIVDADHQNASVTIQDTGLGIAEDEQSKVFNRFYRIDKTRDRETGGTGLGLAISHSTVLLHNGSIRLTSKPDEGSIFVIRIPIRRA